MNTAVFDIGGVLRKVALPGACEIDFAILRALYRTLAASPDWRIIIVTSKPADVDEAMTVAEIDNLKLPQPNDLIIVRGHDKLAAYKQLAPCVVLDDTAECIEQAIAAGVVGLQVRGN